MKLNSYKEISFFKNDAKEQTVSIETLCCNGNLPTNLKLGEINKKYKLGYDKPSVDEIQQWIDKAQ